MKNWHDLKIDFEKIYDPFHSMRADWSKSIIDNNEYWRIAAWENRFSRSTFESLAKLGGKLLISKPTISSKLPTEIIKETNPFNRWLKAIWRIIGSFEFGPILIEKDDNGNQVNRIYTGSINNVIQASIALCTELESEDFLDKVIIIEDERLRLYIEDIDNFTLIKNVKPLDVSSILNPSGRLEIKEDIIKKSLEEILEAPFHKLDWAGEDNDLFSSNVLINGHRITSAFVLKGPGLKSQKLEIRDCGKNGDQLVRLFQSPAELFIVQFIGEISENIIKDVESKTLLKRREGLRAWYCIINGQDTARILKAYNKL